MLWFLFMSFYVLKTFRVTLWGALVEGLSIEGPGGSPTPPRWLQLMFSFGLIFVCGTRFVAGPGPIEP